jgi:GntR family transcriptional regulator
MNIDPASPQHPYRQLAEHLRGQIRRGQVSSQLPSLAALKAETGLATATVRRAIDVLVQEGLVQNVPGRGNFLVR